MFTNSCSLLVLWCVIIISAANASFLDYFIPQKQGVLIGNEIETLPSVPYELSKTDEKFLQEASKLIGASVSELDICHHRVILKLRKSCQELNAEQLGKLSVMLLNCQSNSEGRTLFECTENMSLKDCTMDMDSDTWNAYHLITNRAKAVCVAIRQEQFRGLTEMTVNKLMTSAHEQLTMMDRLAGNQDELHKVTTNALDEMTEKNEKLINQQKQILQVSDAHRTAMESNLHELIREKGLIRSGQLEVARIISELKEKLDESVLNLKQQAKESKQNHLSLTKDLDELHESAYRISDKLSGTTEYILSQNEIASTQFDQTIRQLNEIHETIAKLSNLLRTLETEIDRKLEWISDKVAGNDILIKNLSLVMQHIVYLLLGMLLLVFVNASAFYRIFFIMAVPLNFACTILNINHIDLIQLSEIIGAVFLCNLIRLLLSTVSFKKSFALTANKAPTSVKNQTLKEKVCDSNTDEVEQNDKLDDNSNFIATPQDFSYVSAFKNRYRRENNLFNRNLGRERSLTPSYYNGDHDQASNYSRSSTPFSMTLNDRIRCTALTMKGEQCRHAAITDKLYCRTHLK